MPVGVRERRVAELVRRCRIGLDTTSLRTDVLRRLRELVPVDAAFFATVDPQTLLFTSALAEEPLAAASTLFLDNEFGRDDVNKFASLAVGEPVTSLDRATCTERTTSARYREIMAPLGLGDEMRAALIAGGRCWGVMCLHREDGALGFSDRELRLVASITPHVADGLRLAVLAAGAATDTSDPGPGVLVLDHDFAVISANPAAQYWLGELCEWSPGDDLPVPVQAVIAPLRRAPPAPSPATPAATRIRTREGRWLVLHASQMSGPLGPQTAVVVEAASPAHLSSLILEAHALTAAQMRVAALVVRGRSTQQIVNELRISAYTVQEHLRAVFDKFGVGSRRELVAALLVDHR
jgi:DNA-binding CsgD family transcriptional regulator